MNRGMQIRRSVPSFRHIRQSADSFDQIRKINVNATVTSNFAQIVKTVTCLMTVTQYNFNNSLTPEFKRAFPKKKIINLDELIPTKAEERSLVQISFMTQDKTSRQAQSGIRSKSHGFPNPRIRLVYGKNPRSARFLRPNPSIQKPIHPPLTRLDFQPFCEPAFLAPHHGWITGLPIVFLDQSQRSLLKIE